MMDSLLKIYRITHGLTQQELAGLIGVAASTISKAESGRQGLPAHAAQAFARLRENAIGKGQAIAQPPLNYEQIRAQHMKQSDEYLRIHKKDREALLHKYEKQVALWGEKYIAAMIKLRVVEHTISRMNADHPGAPYLDGFEMNRMEAYQTLLQIGEQKPEIVMIKIEGLKQELRSIKAMLGKKRQYLGMPEDMRELRNPPAVLENGSPALLEEPGKNRDKE